MKRVPLARALQTAQRHDYLDSLRRRPAQRGRHRRDPRGRASGSAPTRWAGPAWTTGRAIAERHGLDLTVVNPLVDATWRFMTLDHDGKIRMDCSSPYAMASLIANRDRYQIATGNDADSDRHGIVTPDGGLMNPNHYLAVAIDYLYTHRPDWPDGIAVGKTAVSSSIIDRVVAGLGRKLVEVPVGFKWFVDGLIGGTIGFGGEESAGASFLRRDGSVWTTDKDGIILALLASEILAVTGQTPVAALPGAGRRVRRAGLRAGRRARRPRAEGPAGQAVGRAGDRDRAGRRADHRQADRRARQRRRAGRTEGDHRQRLVRRPPVGHRGRLQDLRRVFQRSRASGGGAGGRAGGG